MRDQPISLPSSQPHLQIFNHLQVPTQKSTFTLFPFFPTEIRLLIWEHSLQSQRIVNVSLDTTKQVLPCREYTDTGFIDYDQWHRAIFPAHQALSKLFRVNSEARQAALSFYRVQIPCHFFKVNGKKDNSTPMIFYFNPEYDILKFSLRNASTDAGIHFLYHLKYTYDPQGVGVLKLAVDIDSLTGPNGRAREPTWLKSQNEWREHIKETLDNLQEVFFVQPVSVGRQMLGYMSGNASDILFNRSFPIMTTTSAFNRLPRDPRYIAEDLRHIHLGVDPRHMVRHWYNILDKWGAAPSKIDYRVLLAFSPPGQNFVSDYKSAEAWLQNEEDEWTGKWRLGDKFQSGSWALRYWELTDRFSTCQVGALHEKYRDEDLEKAVKPAFGFWLFPIEALGPITEEELGREWPVLCKMTEYWPELALSFLPE